MGNADTLRLPVEKAPETHDTSVPTVEYNNLLITTKTIGQAAVLFLISQSTSHIYGCGPNCLLNKDAYLGELE